MLSGPDGRVLVNGNECPSKKGCGETLSPFHHVSRSLETLKRVPTRPCWQPDLGLPASGAVRNKHPLFTNYSVYRILLEQPKWTKITVLELKISTNNNDGYETDE